jgi:hypothetical protein
MSDEKIDPPGAGVPGLSTAQIIAEVATDAANALPPPPGPRIHVGVGAMVERSETMAGRPRMVLPASRRCSANIPENLNDIWWRTCKVEQPVDETPVQFYDGHEICCGFRKQGYGHFFWVSGERTWSDEQVTLWMPQPSLPK